MSRVIVVGAGVVGLTCAVRLLEAGHRVDVVARDLPLETTSAVAAAICVPLPRPARPTSSSAGRARTTEVLDGPRRGREGATVTGDEHGVRVLGRHRRRSAARLRSGRGHAALPDLADRARSKGSAARSPAST